MRPVPGAATVLLSIPRGNLHLGLPAAFQRIRACAAGVVIAGSQIALRRRARLALHRHDAIGSLAPVNNSLRNGRGREQQARQHHEY
jgi:hypothetical protein